MFCGSIDRAPRICQISKLDRKQTRSPPIPGNSIEENEAERPFGVKSTNAQSLLSCHFNHKLSAGSNSLSDPALFKIDDKQARCWWCVGHDDYIAYHDDEWGNPVDDDHRLFEKICLEGFQAGLSWLTILRKRENFRDAFEHFDFHKVATFSSKRVSSLLKDEGIVRHRGKIEATINNAKRAIEMEAKNGSLAGWFWQYEPTGLPPLKSMADATQRTTCDSAVAMSKALKKLGWKFVGPTTAYAFMQAMGMVNDHVIGCSKYKSTDTARSTFRRPNLE